MPGVQNPHCRPCWSQNACCMGWSFPSCASPSMVVTERPSTCTAKSEHDFTAAPSSRTVQAPHWLVSQPTCVPVRPSASRRKWTRSMRGSTSRVWATPFTLMEMELTAYPLPGAARSEEHTSELQSPYDLVCRLLLEKKNATVLIHMSQIRARA